MALPLNWNSRPLLVAGPERYREHEYTVSLNIGCKNGDSMVKSNQLLFKLLKSYVIIITLICTVYFCRRTAVIPVQSILTINYHICPILHGFTYSRKCIIFTGCQHLFLTISFSSIDTPYQRILKRIILIQRWKLKTAELNIDIVRWMKPQVSLLIRGVIGVFTNFH